MHIREAWIKHTQFLPHSQRDVLNLVSEGVDRVLGKTKMPIVVFDLDSTLFDVSARSLQIVKDWIAEVAQKKFLQVSEKLQNLKAQEFKYSIDDLWVVRNIEFQGEGAEAFQNLKSYWRKRFFGHDYLIHDAPTEGAIEFVNKLHEKGAKVVYLTGRDTPQMGFGTFDQLARHGFPIDRPRSRLVLKPKRHLDDMEFKAGVVQSLLDLGEVVANFENEPKNLVAMGKVVLDKTKNPDREPMMNIFIETVCSDHPAPAAKEIYRIKDFKFE